MTLEEKLSVAIQTINEAFSEIDASELPSRLERIRSFAAATIHSLAPFEDNTVSGVHSRIDKIRDNRISSGFEWNGMRFQSRPSDRENIMGAAQLALAYIGAGGDPASLRWANTDSDFEWILADNGRTPMSAMEVVALFQAGVAFKSSQTFYARALKDAVEAADDPLDVNIIDGWPD